jgi:hypothetical protein
MFWLCSDLEKINKKDAFLLGLKDGSLLGSGERRENIRGQKFNRKKFRSRNMTVMLGR